MKERSCKINVANIRFNVGIAEVPFFRMKKRYAPGGTLERLLTVHQHACFELFIVVGGSLSVYCGDDVYCCKNGGIILPPYIYHYTVPEDIDGYCMNFSIEPSESADPALAAEICAQLSRMPHCFPLSPEILFYTEQFDNRHSSTEREDDIPHLLSLLFSSLLREIAPQAKAGSKRESKREAHVMTIESYIGRHYCEPIRLSDVAAELYLCPKQVSRILMKEYGCSLSELINRRRLTVAASLLRSTDLSVGEIASSVGYIQENHFYKRFRRAYGMSPLVYRRAEKEKTEVD